MSGAADDYDLLGLEPGASRSEIKQAFRSLARVYHSDRYKGQDADERFRQVHAAYQRLLASLDTEGNPVEEDAGVDGADAESYYAETPPAYAPPQDPRAGIRISAVHRDADDLSLLGELNVDAHIFAFYERAQRSLLSTKQEERVKLFFFLMVPLLAFDCGYTEMQQSRGQVRYRRGQRTVFLNTLTAGLLCSAGQGAIGQRTVEDFAPYYPHVGDECFTFQLPVARAQPNAHGLTVVLESALSAQDAMNYLRSHLVGYLSMEPLGGYYLPVGYCRYQDRQGFYRDVIYHPRASHEEMAALCPLDQQFMDHLIGEFFAV